LFDEAVHQAVFTFVAEGVAGRGMLKGKTIGIDATALEAKRGDCVPSCVATRAELHEYLRSWLAEARWNAIAVGFQRRRIDADGLAFSIPRPLLPSART